jgi:ATP-dependent Clp protease ATP-binding subunit ClpB
MLNETSNGEAKGALPAGKQTQSLFVSAISKAGGDPAAVNRVIQKLVVRLPAQEPPPEDASLSQATHRVLREAQNLQKTMVRTSPHCFSTSEVANDC